MGKQKLLFWHDLGRQDGPDMVIFIYYIIMEKREFPPCFNPSSASFPTTPS